MSIDERERAYWGEPKVTPERGQAWRQWRDDYIASCVNEWIAAGATDRDEIIMGAACIEADLARLDDLPWLTMAGAFAARAGALMSGGEGTLNEPLRTDFLRSLRTIETSSEGEQVLALAYHMGVTAQQAKKMRDDVTARHREPDTATGRTALYRHYDDAGALLYVGISKDPASRGEQHRYHSKWHRFVADTQVEWHATRAAAELAEREAIADESPIFNQTHNRANRAAAVDYLFGALEVVAAPVAATEAGRSA